MRGRPVGAGVAWMGEGCGCGLVATVRTCFAVRLPSAVAICCQCLPICGRRGCERGVLATTEL